MIMIPFILILTIFILLLLIQMRNTRRIDLNRRRNLNILDLLQYLILHILQIPRRVLIDHRLIRLHMQIEARLVIRQKLRIRDRVRDTLRLIAQNRRLIAPQTRHILDVIASSANHQHGHMIRSIVVVLVLHVFDNAAMSLCRYIEHANPILRQRVSAALQHNHTRPIAVEYRIDDGFVNAEIAIVVDAVIEGEVDGVVLARRNSNVFVKASAGKEAVAVFMQRQRQYAVRVVEGFLDAVAVMHVDINV
mmetsp:Transcript_66693/g.106008  ORF Transcript_66693/g.106008 Transcript_66693/m.106008 type:complete len:249 (-) Transcript_66693:542-1288(-)